MQQNDRLSRRLGSIVSFVHHMPHYVATRKPGAPTRWGLLFAYHSVDERAPPSRWAAPVPPHWVERHVAAHGPLSEAAEAVLGGDTQP